MNRSASPSVDPPGSLQRDSERCIGCYDAGNPGPTLVVTGGIHGNEPAGVRALGHVLGSLKKRCPPVRGKLVALRGNVQALRLGRRFVDRDLNRRWFPAELNGLVQRDEAELVSEDREQRQLLTRFASLVREADAPVFFLDLHSTSGDGPPFSCMADVLRNRKIAFALPIPVVLGLEEVIEGSMLGYLCDLGHIGVAVEGGRHEDPQTEENHESAIWLTLVAAGCLDPADVPELELHNTRLAARTRRLPPVLEIRHRHVVGPDDRFEMLPGFTSFASLRSGQKVAHDRHGAIVAPEGGLILLPRYQGQGEDGYFVARPVAAVWLEVSAVLRRLRADRLAALLPGVRSVPEHRDAYSVDTRVARFVVQMFHLLGYRRIRSHHGRLQFARRRPDPPSRR